MLSYLIWWDKRRWSAQAEGERRQIVDRNKDLTIGNEFWRQSGWFRDQRTRVRIQPSEHLFTVCRKDENKEREREREREREAENDPLKKSFEMKTKVKKLYFRFFLWEINFSHSGRCCSSTHEVLQTVLNRSDSCNPCRSKFASNQKLFFVGTRGKSQVVPHST